MTVLLIDADGLVYKNAYANQQGIQWSEEVSTVSADPEYAAKAVTEEVFSLQAMLGADRAILALSDPEGNFRRTLYPTYKANRGPRPLLYGFLRKYMQDNFEVAQKPLIEADDVIGILMTHPKLVTGKKVSVSVDKDMLSIPGRHYNPDTEKKRMIGEPEADSNFLRQALTGDSTDNYPGCPGIGPKRAQAIFHNAVHATPTKGVTPERLQQEINAVLWRAIIAAYEKKGLTEDDAILQARLARILRATDWDNKRKEPKLWKPQW